MSESWYSAMLRSVVLIDGEGATDIWRTVVVFRADEWADAQRKAIELGRAKEESYEGGTGHQVRHRLVAVETLDVLGNEVTDGREVYFESADVPDGWTPSFNQEFEPERSEPLNTGI